VTTFLFEAANFLVLAAVLGWLFFNPVRQALADRSSRLAAEEQQASEKLTDANRVEQEIAAAKASLREELNEMRQRELAATHAECERITEETREAANRELESSRRQAALMTETQLNRLAQAVAFAAAETLGHLLEQLRGPDIDEALLKSACDQLRQLPHDDLAKVKVESARPLTEVERTTLEDAMDAASVDYRSAESLGVGLRVSTAGGLVDASASGLVSFARQALLKEMNHRGKHQPLQKTDADNELPKANVDE
jgi:F0F1-type ATP synthase membrane subunit b/b'